MHASPAPPTPARYCLPRFDRVQGAERRWAAEAVGRPGPRLERLHKPRKVLCSNAPEVHPGQRLSTTSAHPAASRWRGGAAQTPGGGGMGGTPCGGLPSPQLRFTRLHQALTRRGRPETSRSAGYRPTRRHPSGLPRSWAGRRVYNRALAPFLHSIPSHTFTALPPPPPPPCTLPPPAAVGAAPWRACPCWPSPCWPCSPPLPPPRREWHLPQSACSARVLGGMGPAAALVLAVPPPAPPLPHATYACMPASRA